MDEANWRDLLSIAAMHRLGPLLHAGVSRKGLWDRLPSEVRAALAASSRRSALRNLKLYGELARSTRLLKAASIPSLALKGAFLARFAYPIPALRPMRDLDLLVPRSMAIAAFDALRLAGYVPMHHGLPDSCLDGRLIHLPPLRSPTGITVELHHRLAAPDPSRPGADDFEQRVWQRAIVRTVGQEEIRFPCAEDLLLHLCHHATIGHQFSLGPITMVDILYLVDTTSIDWQDFLNNVHACQWQRCSLAPLHLARQHLGAAIPEDVLSALQDDADQTVWVESANYLLFAKLTDHVLLNTDVQGLLQSHRLSRRLTSLLRLAFPSRKTIAMHFPVAADSPRVLIYYPLNWFRLAQGKIPGLMSALLTRRRDVRALAAHKSAMTAWMNTPPQPLPADRDDLIGSA